MESKTDEEMMHDHWDREAAKADAQTRTLPEFSYVRNLGIGMLVKPGEERRTETVTVPAGDYQVIEISNARVELHPVDPELDWVTCKISDLPEAAQ